MSWTYILLCSDGALYVGSTKNLDHRMFQHATGVADAFTRTRKPLTLVFAAEFDNIGEAYAFERRLKGWRREKKIALIESRFEDLPALARKKWGPPRGDPQGGMQESTFGRCGREEPGPGGASPQL